MPRSNRPRRAVRDSVKGAAGRRPAPQVADGDETLGIDRLRSGWAQRESAPDGVWMVRSISASSAAKVYTCPGCHRPVGVGVSHLVVWAEDSLFGLEAGLAERRHWHTNCWRTRSYKYR